MTDYRRGELLWIRDAKGGATSVKFVQDVEPGKVMVHTGFGRLLLPQQDVFKCERDAEVTCD